MSSSSIRNGWMAFVWGTVLVMSVLLFPASAQATPGWTYGNDMWFKPGTSNINGTLYAYKNDSLYTSMTAGSGMGSAYSTCQSNLGRLPDGWYSSAHDHHVDNKDNTIKGRVWGLQDKDCGSGTVRTELFIHSEETKTNGQSCPTSGDDPYCWESAAEDYRSLGCVKISHANNGYPDSVGSLNSWWHNQVGGQHSTYTLRILWVGSSAPPAPPT